MIAIVVSRSLTLSIHFTYILFLLGVRFILLVHIYLVYVSSVYFLLYKHTGAGEYSPIKVPESCFMGVTQIHFRPCGYQSNNNKLYKGTETTLAAVILGFSTLSGTNPQI